jgi:hypothetical protein
MCASKLLVSSFVPCDQIHGEFRHITTLKCVLYGNTVGGKAATTINFTCKSNCVGFIFEATLVRWYIPTLR